MRAAPPAQAASFAPALLVGRVATIVSLVSRPELGGALVLLNQFEASRGRWTCLLNGGEQFRILPENLKPIAESGQTFMKLRYKSV